LNEIFSPHCRLQMYRVIRDLWTLLHNMIYVLVIKKVRTNMCPIVHGYGVMAA